MENPKYLEANSLAREQGADKQQSWELNPRGLVPFLVVLRCQNATGEMPMELAAK